MRKQLVFLCGICCDPLFTCFFFAKIIIENLILNAPDNNYVENCVTAFILCIVVTGLFALAPKMSHLPLWTVQLTGHICILIVLMLCIWIEHFFVELSLSAYRDMFWSFTFCYFPVVVIYYLKMYHDIKKGNEDLEYIQDLVKREYYRS